MAARKRKVKRFVIDVNCYITIFIIRQTNWLFHYVLQNRLEIFVDDNLIDELTRVLQYPHIKKLIGSDISTYIGFVKIISTKIESSKFYIQSPDPDDNYLYDIALTAHAKLLVTGETALLDWEDAPIKTISLPAFKRLF